MIRKENFKMADEIQELKQKANAIRKCIIEMAYQCGRKVHLGPSLSCADLVTALYFKFMRIDPENPNWEERDRFIMSKGHAYTVLYAALCERGFFGKEELRTLRHPGSNLQGHPTMGKTPGVDMTAGSLGNGLGIGIGMAYYLKLRGKHSKVFVMLGDGESNEGSVWEAAMQAPVRQTDNLIAFVDYNHFQSCGPCEEILPMGRLADKWKAFGWNVLEVNGHDMAEIVNKIEIATNFHGAPTMIIAHTIKGKGISFMEHSNKWHVGLVTEEIYRKAINELEEAAKCR
jgi:transketolase